MFIRVCNSKKFLLYQSYIDGDIIDFKKLIKNGENVNCICPNGRSLLSNIVSNTARRKESVNREYFNELMLSNVHFGAIGSEYSILKLAICNRKSIYYLEKLLDYNIEISSHAEQTTYQNIMRKPGSLIYYALTTGDLDKIKLILKHVRPVDMSDVNGDSIMIHAVKELNSAALLEVMPLLIELGGDIMNVGVCDKNCMDWAKALHRNEKVFEFLKQKGLR